MSARIINTNCFGIVVTLDGEGGGAITSELHDTDGDDETVPYYNAAMDGIEAVVLAHAVAGVDITSPAYYDGIETAVQACATNI